MTGNPMRRRVGNHQDIDEEKPEIVMNLVKLQPVEHVSIQVLSFVHEGIYISVCFVKMFGKVISKFLG